MKNTGMLMRKFYSEFKEFAIKGSMIDIAVGVIIGAAFNGVIDVLVKKVLMPPLSLLTQGIHFQNKKIVLRNVVMQGEEIISEEVAIEYGELITTLLNFFIIAWVVFLIVKVMNRIRNRAFDVTDKKEKTPKNIELLADLKTLMQQQNELLKKQQEK